MTHAEGELRTAAGAVLYFQSWLPSGAPRATLLIAHGLAEHSGRYAHFAGFFVERGYAVFALDHIGHGKSEGERCHIGRFSEYTDGVSLLLERVRDACPDTDAFLVGHSMGGLIAAVHLLERQNDFAGCIVSGAAVKATEEPPWMQLLLLRFFSKVLPRLRVLQLDASQVSRDPDVVDRYRADPLVFSGKVTARLAEQLFAAMAALESRLDSIELPMLILHGSKDGLTLPEGSKMLHDKISSHDRELIIYDGLYHEVYNEPEQEAVMTDVANWLAVR